MAKCSCEGCDKEATANGMCGMHRMRLRRHGHTEQTRPADWGNRESHPLFDSWHKLRRGNKMEDVWQNFWTFVKDVGERPENTRLWRKNEECLYGPDNFYWRPIKLSIKDYDGRAAYMRAYRKQNPEKFAHYELKRNFDLTPDNYRAMLESQDGKCAICGNPEVDFDTKANRVRNLAVDHNHETGQIRALLCRGCNQGLGNFQEDLSRLEAAVSYLKRFAV